MGFVELFLIGVGLSMDAFAVSICKGLGMKRLNMGQALVIGLFFGGFQALMPLIGWALGTQLADFITPIDHWIALPEKAQVVNRRVCKMDDASPGLTHISTSFVHGEPFSRKKPCKLWRGLQRRRMRDTVRSSQRSASKLWHLRTKASQFPSAREESCSLSR